MSDRQTEFLIDQHVIAQSVGEEIVLLDMRNELYLGLNQVGSTIWRFLEAGKTVREIENSLLTTHPTTPAQRIIEDLENLITQLLDRKLIRARV